MSNIVYAQNSTVGKVYKTASQGYLIKVVKINMAEQVCTSVTVVRADNPKEINIAGGTELHVTDATFESFKLMQKEEKPIKQLITKEKVMTRSSIIDAMLGSDHVNNQISDAGVIADAVIAAGLAIVEDRKKVIAQVKARLSWYNKGEKPWPAAVELEANVSGTESAEPVEAVNQIMPEDEDLYEKGYDLEDEVVLPVGVVEPEDEAVIPEGEVEPGIPG